MQVRRIALVVEVVIALGVAAGGAGMCGGHGPAFCRWLGTQESDGAKNYSPYCLTGNRNGRIGRKSGRFPDGRAGQGPSRDGGRSAGVVVVAARGRRGAPVGRADEIVQRINEAIHLGLLDDGERLPVEVDLAAQFGVAPMTVREALATLREQGLVETRRGRSGGSFVRRPAGPPVDKLTARLAAMSASDIRDLFDEHTAVSGQAARLAAERAAPYAVRRLFALTDQLGAAATLGDRIRADSRFHIQVAIASQSARLARREANLQAEVAGLVWLPIGQQIDVAAHVEEQHAIAAAVAAENAEEARRLAEAHVMGQLARLTQVNLDLTATGRRHDPDHVGRRSGRRSVAAVGAAVRDAPRDRRRGAAHPAAAGGADRGALQRAAPQARRPATRRTRGLGMGFIAAPFVVEDQERYLAWWQRNNNDRVARLRLNFDPTSIDVYDYLQMDWYQLAKRGRRGSPTDPTSTTAGPTCTPSPRRSRSSPTAPSSVAGADLVVGEIERTLLEVLRQTDDDAVVVNTERRVIAANTARWVVGSRLAAVPAVSAQPDPHAFRQVAEMPLGTGWVVAIGWPESAQASPDSPA